MAAYRHVNNITTLFIYLFIGIIIIIIEFFIVIIIDFL